MSSPATRLSHDADVRQRVTDPERSFLVQAPAGSGKTELLTQRYLRVLTTVERPEQVLAITFTRKAASEMRIRVMKACEDAALSLTVEELRTLDPHKRERRELACAVLAHDRALGWNLLENPQRLQIRTVDSFCDSVARQLPALAGIAAELGVTEDAGPLYLQAADLTLMLLGESDERLTGALTTLFLYLDNNVSSLRELLVSMLKKRDQWMRLIGRSDRFDEEELEHHKQQLQKSLTQSIEAELRSARSELLSILGEVQVEQIAAWANIPAATIEDFAPLAGLSSLPEPTSAALPQWRALRRFVVTDKTIRKSFDKRNGFLDKEQAKLCKQFFEQLGEDECVSRVCELLKRVAGKLPDPRYSDEEWQFVRALLIVLPLAVANLKITFAQQGAVDFMEMAQAATAALRTSEGPTELALAMGSTIRHILVDEFQDTSKSQMDLVAALTSAWEQGEGNSLFAVGDPMQSIYAFREAEVTLFTRAARTGQIGTSGLGYWTLISERLRSNFRSQAGLIDWFNSAFPHIFGGNSEATGAVPYAESVASKRSLPGEAVQIHALPTTKDVLGEAERVAQLAQEALKEDAKSRVAILVRSRSHLTAIVEALKSHEIPYRAVKIDALGKRQVVRDLDALARALLNLADRTAWLAVLRAPWCGLTLAELSSLCERDREQTIWALLEQNSAGLSSVARVTLDRVVPVLRRALDDRGRVPLRLWVERTWISLGGPASLAGDDREEHLRDAAAFFSLLDKCSALHVQPGSPRFRQLLEELYSPADTSPNARLELMTIHTAKGLEWDTVILPCLGRTPRNDDKQLLYWREVVEDGSGLLLAPTRSRVADDKQASIEGYLRMLAEDRTAEERKRLLYVAATRARRRLHLTFTQPDGDAPRRGSLLDLLWRVPFVREACLSHAPEPAQMSASVAAAHTPKLRRLPHSWQMPAAPEPLMRANGVLQSTADDQLHTFDWAGQTRRRIGTVTHAFLQELARRGPLGWPREAAELRSAIRVALAGQGIGPTEMERALNEVQTALANVLCDETGRWILGSHSQAVSEFAITTATEQGNPVRLVVDRTFVDEEGTRWVIDFKTTHIEGGSSEDFLAAQVEKYREDLARYAHALSLFDPRRVRCGLYFPLQSAWREVIL